MEHASPSRRKFLMAIGNLSSAAWVAANWPQIAHAAQHSGQDADPDAPHSTLDTLSAAQAAEVDAIANQIVPGGATPGARDAGVIYFIDNALGSFFADQRPSFLQGLAEFERRYAEAHGAGARFSAAPDAQQIAFLHTVDKTPFFSAVRRLTVLGLIALPKYGGNRNYAGWNLLGVEDNHVWAPPFGYYDTDYPGFEPYPGTKPYTA
ncbi:MAG: gluconate 2-dehydrogenase subunit 3 family protein [Polymorphobacter sp.]|uniref:gluconate 2-dehydrogenase subunit 3 family protein n=1 Tax=Polymorphobacter sp. TaxID=1909290 RepID=UPI003A878654